MIEEKWLSKLEEQNFWRLINDNPNLKVFL
jgi:hypothetical protein